MPRKLNVLLAEDSADDAVLEIDALVRAGFDPQWELVQTETDYLAKLRPGLDVIISDYDMKGFNGERTLELLIRSGYTIPFILVTGTVGEEKGAEIIRQGASDFVFKGRLARLGTAVKRALEVKPDQLKLKRTEAQLRWKTAFLEAKVESSIDGVLVVDSEGRKILHNRRFVELWHLPAELADEIDQNGRLQWMIAQTKDPTKFIEKVTYLYAHPEEISRDEIELIDGNVLDRYSSPVRGEDGTSYGRIWSYRDITERKRSEQKIAEQAALLDETQDAVLVRDLEGGILFWNKGAERMYGWTNEEALGRNAGELLFSNPAKFHEIRSFVLDHDQWSGEVQQTTKDQRALTVESRWTLVRDDKGDPKSILSINTDVTESKNMESHLLRAQRMESIGTLAGGIAHDLNNILAPIVMAISLLKDLTKEPQALTILATIEISAKRGTDIIKQILSFARGQKGERTGIHLKQLLNELEKIVRDTFPKNIRPEFVIGSDPWAISGDPTQLHQVLLNLCLNARDAMPEGGVLTISLENVPLDGQVAAKRFQAIPGQYVVVSVSDTGTGITKENIDRIFEPFFTTKDVGKGTGLGLSMVASIVKSHGGFVTVRSALGQGTTFQVYLPAQENSLTAADVSAKPSAPRGRGEVILLIDDEQAIRSITAQTLRGYGYQVLTASNGAEALAIYQEHSNEVAAVITDMAMPIMDGRAAVEALVNLNPNIKIIAASGRKPDTADSAAGLSGIRYFLTKPFSGEVLLQTLRKLLDE